MSIIYITLCTKSSSAKQYKYSFMLSEEDTIEHPSYHNNSGWLCWAYIAYGGYILYHCMVVYQNYSLIF